MSYWSWALEGIGLLGAFVVGRKRWWGWVILLVNTVLWGVYATESHQYGFMVASFFYAPLYARNLIKWLKEKR
jgi:nicotinamide riboside transporter PnuC